MNWFIFIIILIVIVFIVLLFFLIILFLRILQKRKAHQVLEKFKGRNILKYSPNANCFGLESLGLAQIRGNGVLVLLEDEIYFQMGVPKKEISIPLKMITNVEIVHSHLGKAIPWPLLKISFTNQEGKMDSVAWVFKNVQEWKDTLEEKIKPIH